MQLAKWLLLRRDEMAGGAGAGGAGGAAGAGAAGGQGEGAAGAGKAAAGAAGGAQDWRSTLPEDIRGDESLARYKTPEEAHRGLINANKALRTVVTKVPGKDAKPEEIVAFREKLGIPADVAKYREAVKLPTIEGVTWDPKAVEGFTAKAHGWGIPPDVIPHLLSEFAAYQQGSTQRMVGQWVKEQDALEDEWGADYDGKVQAGKTGFAYYSAASEGRLDKIFGASGLDKNPDVLRMFAHVGELLQEHGFVEGEIKPDGAREQGLADIAVIENNPKHPAMDRSHPDHREANARYVAMLKRTYGTQEIR